MGINILYMIALITGISGQDGSYLAEFLLGKGYIVHGIKRRSSSLNTSRIDHIFSNPNLILHYGDLADSSCIESLIREIQPDEVYNLAAMSHVKVSFEIPVYTADIDAIGTVRLLESIRKLDKKVKFYQAGTSEMFGDNIGGILGQDETTTFSPKSPYAISKVFSHFTVKNYRESYGIFAVNGILFNHTSPRRGETFVEQKIIKAALAIVKSKQDCLYLGNLYSYRDFGHSKDYVRAMWQMLQQNTPGDFVIATGSQVNIKDLTSTIFAKVGLPLIWSGRGLDECGSNSGRILVRVDKKYFRPSEVNSLLGNATKAKYILGWKPEYTLDMILDEMIQESS